MAKSGQNHSPVATPESTAPGNSTTPRAVLHPWEQGLSAESSTRFFLPLMQYGYCADRLCLDHFPKQPEKTTNLDMYRATLSKLASEEAESYTCSSQIASSTPSLNFIPQLTQTDSRGWAEGRQPTVYCPQHWVQQTFLLQKKRRWSLPSFSPRALSRGTAWTMKGTVPSSPWRTLQRSPAASRTCQELAVTNYSC